MNTFPTKKEQKAEYETEEKQKYRNSSARDVVLIQSNSEGLIKYGDQIRNDSFSQQNEGVEWRFRKLV